MSDFNSSLPVRTENAGDVIAKIADATVPSQQLAVNSDGSINITDNGGSLTVDATNLDIRDLSSAQDSVEVLQASHDNLNANANIQVGNADVANGNPVPVSDAGGSLTVDATDLDIRNLSAAQDNVAISDGTDTLAINNDGSINSVVSATDLDIRDLSHTQDSVKVGDGTDFLAVNTDGSLNITDNGGSLTVDAVDLDIRDLSHTQDSIKIGDGTDFLAINADGSINVSLASTPAGDEINNYNTAANVAGGGSSNHDYTVSAGKVFTLNQIEATGSGKMKIEVQIESGVGTGSFSTRFVQFNSTATPNMQIRLSAPISVAAGVRVRVIRTNREGSTQDLFSTISGQEV